MTKTAEMTTAQFASEIGTDPKTLRKYLRSVTPRDEQPGKGSRWVLPGTKTAITAHRKSFAKWQKEQADAAAERAAKAASEAQDALDASEDLNEDAELESGDLGPELEDITDDEGNIVGDRGRI